MVKFPDPKNLAKLTPEQLKVYLSWKKESEETEKLLQQSLDALAAHDNTAVIAIFKKLDALVPQFCEHNVSVFQPCSACEEIERLLYPEDFDANGNLLPRQPVLDKKYLN